MSERPPIDMSQAEFARHRGVSKAVVTKWKGQGLLVLTDDGRVNVEETERKLGDRPPRYRGGTTHQTTRRQRDEAPTPAKPRAGKVDGKPRGRPAEMPADGSDADDLDLDAADLPLAEAVRRKENFLGLLRKRELEVANGEWVRIEDVGALVEGEYAMVRNRLLGMPGQLAALLVDADRGTIEATIRQKVTEALDELHDPAGFAERAGAGGKASPGEAGA